LRAPARLGQCFLVGRNSGVGFALQALCFRKIALDALAARLQDRADAWQRDPRHQQVKGNKSQREPEQLRSERLRVERREPATMLARGNMLDSSNRLRALLSHRQLRTSRGGKDRSR
jgi:hypothetical protein